MTRATFFKHFDLLADQPDAVAEMRELVFPASVNERLVEISVLDRLAATFVASMVANETREKLKRELQTALER